MWDSPSFGRIAWWSRSAAATLASAARRHWVFACLLVVGAVVRGMAQLAYLPALLRYDSLSYLETSVHLQPELLHPAGYPIFLKIVRAITADVSLQFIPLVQHFGVAIVVYLVQLRVGVQRALGALAVAPLLLDAYWVNLEQGVTSETVFLALVVLACAAVLWRHPLPVTASAVAALALAAATITRTIGVLLIPVFVVVVVALADRPARVRQLVVFLLVVALPLGAYAAWFHRAHGRYALAGFAPRILYGRVATFVDCSTLSVPREERRLCPDAPVSERSGPAYYTWNKASPYYQLPTGVRNDLASRFARRAITRQPLSYVRTVLGDVIRGFSPTREDRAGERPVSRWQFQRRHPVFVKGVLCGEETPGTIVASRCSAKLAKLRFAAQRFGDRDMRVNLTLARWLTGYRRIAFVPGPLFAAALIAGTLGALGIGRRRGSNFQAACFLMTAVPTILIVGPVAATQFEWRYQLLGLILTPVAGALGVTAILRARSKTDAQPGASSTNSWSRHADKQRDHRRTEP